MIDKSHFIHGNPIQLNSKINYPGIYLHIPFCVSRCSYCDFYSTTELDLRDKFTQALVEEIRLFGEQVKERYKIDTIYFGGGTPSLLSARQMENIFRQINSTFEIIENSEITLEANPGTIDLEYIKEYRNMGINRISFGVQSFDDKELKILNRIHSSKEAIESYHKIREIGFDNVSLDLIYGIPSQTVETWESNLKIIKSLEPEHISAYNLIYEKGTKMETLLQNKVFDPMDEEVEEQLFLKTSDFLEESGYEHYEVSNFAKPGFQSRHNSKYWKHIPYFGFGPSAHSFQNNERYWNFSNLAKYFKSIDDGKLPIQNREILDKNDLLIEKIMLSFRSEGLDLQQIKDEFNIDLKSVINNHLTKYSDYFLIDNNKFILKKKGYFVLNEILVSLINAIEIKKF